MRMRRKKHLEERVELCAEYLVTEPENYRGKWLNTFGAGKNKLYLEIGCGKGKFIHEKSKADQTGYYLAMEKITNVIITAMETAKAENIQNVKFINKDAEILKDYFSENELDGIYLNFSDPWKKRDQHHRRLTYKTFLETYKFLLKQSAFIEFKSDNFELFEFSVKSFKNNGYEITQITYDLHNSEFAMDNIMTEYEINFSSKGLSINYLKAIPILNKN